MKKCSRCNEEKELSEFYNKRTEKNRVGSYCKICQNNQAIERQQEFKRKCVNFKGGKCELCGYNKCLAALEFHHQDPNEKDFSISQAKATGFEKNFDRIISELNKCLLLCANCHRESHFTVRLRKVIIRYKIPSKGELQEKIKIMTLSQLASEYKKTKNTILKWLQNYKLSGQQVKAPTKRPPKEVLEKLLWEKPTTHIAKEYGVADNCISKWARKYKLKKPPRGYWQKKQAGKL